jgi:hypothetical protein
MGVSREQAWAAGREAGARSMIKAGRIAWNAEDLRAAAIEFDRVSGALPAKRKAAKPETRAKRRAKKTRLAVTLHGGSFQGENASA